MAGNCVKPALLKKYKYKVLTHLLSSERQGIHNLRHKNNNF